MANLKKQFKVKQEKKGAVFISGENYVHPGWVRLGTMTKARGIYSKVLGENIRNFQSQIAELENRTWFELSQGKIRDGRPLTKQDKRYLKQNKDNSRVGSAGFRNSQQTNMRSLFTAPGYMPGTEIKLKSGGTAEATSAAKSREAWNRVLRKQRAASSLRQGRFGFKAGGRIDRSKPKYPKLLRNKEYNLSFKAYFDKSAFIKQSTYLTEGVYMLSKAFLGDVVHRTVVETRREINNRPGTSKSKHFKKKSRWGHTDVPTGENSITSFNARGSAHKLTGDAISRIARSLYGNLIEEKGEGTQKYSRYISFIIGSFDEGDSSTRPTGARGSRMKKGGKSLTELRENSQQPFRVRPNVRPSPKSGTAAYFLGKGTRFNRRQGMSGRTFRKQLKRQ